MGIGERIKARRRELGYSAEKLAELASLSPATIYRYESAGIASMRADKLRPIAAALNTTPAALMGWEPEDLDALRSEWSMRVEDEAMSPGLLPGDIVYLRRQEDVRDGEIAAVELGGQILLRRLYRTPRGLMLAADNPACAPLFPGQELEILGRAAAFRRNL